eukprot:7115213-Prymnesium_polylepis.1
MSPPSPPSTPPPTMVLDEQFIDSSQFTVISGAGAAQPFFSDGWYDYFGLMNGASSTFSGNAGSNSTGSDAAPRSPPYFGFTTPFLVAQDIDAEGAMVPFILQWTSINVSSCASMQFSGKFAESGWRGTDTADFVYVMVSIDNGPPQNVLWLTADGDGSNDRFAVDTDFDQRGDGTALTPFAQTLTSAIQGTGTLLDLRILMKVDAANEDIAIDDLQILCSTSAPPTPPPASPSSPPLPPSAPVPTLALDEPFDNSAQFSVVDRNGATQSFFSDG